MDYGNYGGFAWPRLTQGVKLLLIINAAVFVANMIAFPLIEGGLGRLMAVSWPGLWDGFGLGLVRVITYQFAHDFYSAMHLLINMMMLYFFGTMVEESIGKQRLIRLYLAAGVAGAVGHILLAFALGQSARPMIGASGAVYGILVYAAFMAPRARVILIIFPIELRWLVGGLVALGIYATFVELTTGAGGSVAHGGHLGGAAWGFVAFRLPARQWQLGARVQQWQAERSAQSDAEKRARLDELLEKVHREGLTALTGSERRFLDKASKDLRRK